MTPNKKANSGDLAYYHQLQSARRSGGSHYLYEATVGAGLPVVQTLRDLRETGDEITSIEGIFSGTLAYLFNVYDGRRGFSEIVHEARQRGFTEPDPRDDLSGMDVARKLIILGREMGLALELKDVKVESLVPPELADDSIEDFMTRLPQYDAAMAARLSGAHGRGKVLRYTGTLTAGGERQRRAAGARCAPSVRQHRAHRQRRALRHAALLRQSAHRAGTGCRSGGHRRRRVRRPAAPGGLSRSAAVSAAPRAQPRRSRRPRSATSPSASTFSDLRSMHSATGCGHAPRRAGSGASPRCAASPASCRATPRDNTAGRALLAMQEALRPGFGFTLEIDKGIPLGSGLGGSAASAVAAVVAANALLPAPCSGSSC